MDYVSNKVSVIIPVYNREKVIEECVESVFAQSHQDFEIILVDDGSTDNTFALCRELAAKDSRIKLYASQHGGVSVARNIALEHVTGEYVFFLDSDDVIHPSLLETIVTGMRENNASVGATDVFRIRDEVWNSMINRVIKPEETGEITVLSADETIAAAFKHPSPLGCIGGVMMRSDLIGDTKFHPDIYIGEDFYFIYENIIKGAPSVFLKQKWYFVRNHANNTSWDYSFNGFWTRFYRRKLVWESEMALGRVKNANSQKIAAFSCATLCMERCKPNSEDGRKIRQTLKEFKKEIFPVMNIKWKVMYFLTIYFPSFILWVLRVLKRKKAHSRKK